MRRDKSLSACGPDNENNAEKNVRLWNGAISFFLVCCTIQKWFWWFLLFPPLLLSNSFHNSIASNPILAHIIRQQTANRFSFNIFFFSTDLVQRGHHRHGMAFVYPINLALCVRSGCRTFRMRLVHWRRCQKADWSIWNVCCHFYKINQKIVCIWMFSPRCTVRIEYYY